MSEADTEMQRDASALRLVLTHADSRAETEAERDVEGEPVSGAEAETLAESTLAAVCEARSCRVRAVVCVGAGDREVEGDAEGEGVARGERLF